MERVFIVQADICFPSSGGMEIMKVKHASQCLEQKTPSVDYVLSGNPLVFFLIWGLVFARRREIGGLE